MSDVVLAKPFVQATITVISSMCSIAPKPEIPFVKHNNFTEGDVSAIIGITGSKTGAICLTFPKKCAIAMVNGMLGDDVEDLIADIRDTVGELSNMISGQARAGLSELGIPLQGSTPTVVFGKHTVSFANSAPIIVIPFTTEHGNFTLEFCLQ